MFVNEERVTTWLNSIIKLIYANTHMYACKITIDLENN